MSYLAKLKKELQEGDKGNYAIFSIAFSGYSARQLVHEIELLEKQAKKETGK